MKSRYIAVSGCVAVTFLVAVLLRSGGPEPATMDQLIELPRPNSGSFTFQQAEARKGEIYRMMPTGQLADWEPPEFGIGFSVHIANNDSIVVEHFRMPRIDPEVERLARDGLEALTGNRYIENPTHVHRDLSLTELDQFVAWTGVLNSGAFVVLTSESDPADSSVFPQVLDRLFKPSVRLHYVPQKQQIEQDGDGDA